MSDSTEIDVAAALDAARGMETASAGWTGEWAGHQGAITGAESPAAFGNDQLGSALRSGYQPGSDALKPQVSLLPLSWRTLADGSTRAAEAVRAQDEANAASLRP